MKALLYCTKSKPYLHKLMSYNEWYIDNDLRGSVNGFIVAQCDIELKENWKPEESCLTVEQCDKYLGDKKGYALRISNLSEYSTMLDLSCFYKKEEGRNDNDIIDYAPQNMMYAYDWYGEKYVLISIQPQWLCKILNGEKTIEIRKKVLNGLKQHN